MQPRFSAMARVDRWWKESGMLDIETVDHIFHLTHVVPVAHLSNNDNASQN